MKTFHTACAQGDVYIRRVDEIPQGAKRADLGKASVATIAHSETGHSHVVELERPTPRRESNVEIFDGDNPLISWIKVNRPAVLKHLRPFDTHAPIQFAPGIYEIRRQREYSPEGWRRVAD